MQTKAKERRAEKRKEKKTNSVACTSTSLASLIIFFVLTVLILLVFSSSIYFFLSISIPHSLALLSIYTHTHLMFSRWMKLLTMKHNLANNQPRLLCNSSTHIHKCMNEREIELGNSQHWFPAVLSQSSGEKNIISEWKLSLNVQLQ